MSDQQSSATRDSIDIESYHLQKGQKLLDQSQNFKSENQSDSQFQNGALKNTDKKGYNSFSQGYSCIWRLIWFHFISMVKKLKNIEQQGRRIEVDDLPELEDHAKVEYTAYKLKEKIEKLDPEKVTSLGFLKIIGLAFKKSVLAIMTFLFLENITKLMVPYCMQKLIQLVKEGDIQQASLWVFLLVFSSFLGITFGQNGWTGSQRLCAQLRLGLINILYQKVSNLSAFSVKKANVGKIINMISSDFSIFEVRAVNIFTTALAPITLSISCGMLCYRIGYIAIPAIFLMIGLFPLQKKIAQAASEYTKQQSKHSDQKIKLFSEMMDGIRIIKMYGWEKAFNSTINKFRSLEVRNTLINQIIMYIEHAFSLNGPLFVALLCFLFIDMYEDNFLDTAIIFSTIELINLISNTIMKNVGYGLSFIFEFKVLVQRYMSVISIENVQMKSIDNPHMKPNLADNPPSPDTLVYMKDFSAYWQTEDLENQTPVLQDINFTIKKGETVSIIGQIGSGKTSFLFAIMQEIPRYKGVYYSVSQISFAEQEPFILQGTVRDNILFGKSYDEKFYKKVVKACCLLDDYKQFSNGDLTVVGERGSNLSGGQKARICLARAVYADTDLYLLDDPLSAVDSKVAKKIFKNVINGMLKDKGVILVTHQLNYALRCQRIAVFENGNIILQGNPNEINFSQTSLAKHIENIENHHVEDENQLDISMEQQILQEIQKEEDEQDNDDENQDSSTKQKDIQTFKNDKEINNVIKPNEDRNSTIFSSSGKKEDEYPVTKDTYINYFLTNPSPWIFMLVVFTFIIQEFLFTSFYKSLSLYEYEFNREQFYAISFGILTAFFVFKFVQCSFMSYFVLQTNQSLTQKMIRSISQARPILFDEIPSGQIINKYSTDISILDKNLPEAAQQTVEGVLHFINLIGSVIFINQYFIIPGVFEVFLFYKWFRYIKPTLMRAKQLDLENKTPVFQFFQSSLNGILIINIYGQKQLFQQKMAVLMNNSIRTADIFWFVSRLFSVSMQYFALAVSGVGIYIILFLSSSDNPKFAESLTYLLLLTNFLHMTLRAVINMDTFMTSSERACSIIDLPRENIELSDIDSDQLTHDDHQHHQTSQNSQRNRHYNQLQSEQSSVSIEIEDFNQERLNKNSIQSNKWPSQGNLKFDNVFMRYKEGMNPVLKGVSFEAKPLERVAIVGRTGAGKSSIIQALFRMSEIDISSEQGPSRIFYDDQNTRDVGLHLLRRSISIIPQNPFVFSGSIRRNIDPLDEYTDQQIYHVLRETGLNELISKLPQGIETDMSDSASVFSMGQRQLVCLARVMLRRNKLMVLDEATANVDMETDHLIQELIKEKFQDTTIITIAHRLNTIADYDKIIVLDAGKVVEIDTPFNLLALREEDQTITNTESVFAQMVLNTGAKNGEQIFQICKKSYLEKKKNI
ncbi:ABC transporter family protein (macronuclear) [Tetrahymena thermophila SB210]|uniref:ABC transporter family protein n=1 Tax=Tetrahymena thermophila (strain SB210) TaxID=312017 RepID=Q240Q6_TETTS|nr:ABC transporter family protein [Tetrahymena thermophila SB210]EAS02358.2 ABC transporter family protein [Tetrahymena thermophila SB210]|eukprot:XP_001022603.2 ABC transporter family protein [Tetrahymena thermophila SB210]